MSCNSLEGNGLIFLPAGPSATYETVSRLIATVIKTNFEEMLHCSRNRNLGIILLQGNPQLFGWREVEHNLAEQTFRLAGSL